MANERHRLDRSSAMSGASVDAESNGHQQE